MEYKMRNVNSLMFLKEYNMKNDNFDLSVKRIKDMHNVLETLSKYTLDKKDEESIRLDYIYKTVYIKWQLILSETVGVVIPDDKFNLNLLKLEKMFLIYTDGCIKLHNIKNVESIIKVINDIETDFALKTLYGDPTDITVEKIVKEN